VAIPLRLLPRPVLSFLRPHSQGQVSSGHTHNAAGRGTMVPPAGMLPSGWGWASVQVGLGQEDKGAWVAHGGCGAMRSRRAGHRRARRRRAA